MWALPAAEVKLLTGPQGAPPSYTCSAHAKGPSAPVNQKATTGLREAHLSLFPTQVGQNWLKGSLFLARLVVRGEEGWSVQGLVTSCTKARTRSVAATSPGLWRPGAPPAPGLPEVLSACPNSYDRAGESLHSAHLQGLNENTLPSSVQGKAPLGKLRPREVKSLGQGEDAPKGIPTDCSGPSPKLTCSLFSLILLARVMMETTKVAAVHGAGSASALVSKHLVWSVYSSPSYR